ncbi:MAG: hypothetical protein HFI36_07430 [Bacilli bacterium]|jgi:hypothetical protein|nr:hypothetical protein [Bacilli bacterium]
MKEEYFVNIAISRAIELYLSSSKNKDSILYNSFLVVTVRILAFIYGELDVLNPYYLNNSVAFFNNLAKYGMSRADIAIFKEEFLNYYKFEEENNNGKIKFKNPYFKNVLKYLVDMFIFKRNSVEVTYQEEEMFLDLAYTSHTKNPYRVSYNYLASENPQYIEKYYYSKVNQFDVTSDLSKTISTNLNLEALKYVGVDLSSLKNMSKDEIENAKNEAYNYFMVDATSPSRDDDLESAINNFKNYGKKVTTGNGYVDILLLMSVIVTSFSVIAIIIFSLA